MALPSSERRAEPPKTSATPAHVKAGSGAPLKICVETTVEMSR